MKCQACGHEDQGAWKECPECGGVQSCNGKAVPGPLRRPLKSAKRRFSPKTMLKDWLASLPRGKGQRSARLPGYTSSDVGCRTLLAAATMVFFFIRAEVDAPQAPSQPQAAVFNSGLDGAVFQVEAYLKTALKDPESLQTIEWGRVIKRKEGGYAVRFKYRAKNSFGGYVISDQWFFLDEAGQVTGVVDKQ